VIEMIEKSNKKQIRTLIFVISAIVIMDILTIVTNLYLSPYLDGYGLPDILIYLKLAIFAFILTILLIWYYNDNYNITKSNLKIIMYLSLVTILGYFLSLFLYKYILLLDTADIIKNKILYGNPALILDYSMKNYKTLSYITQVFGGFNSEIVLFIEGLAIQFYAMKVQTLSVTEEEEHVYDPFLFDKMILWLFILLTIFSFLSINIFQTKYNIYESIEMALGLSGFAISVLGLITASHLMSITNHTCTKSKYVSSNRLMMIIGILNLLLFGALTILTLIDFQNEIASYRIYPIIGVMLVSIIIIYKTFRNLSLENK